MALATLPGPADPLRYLLAALVGACTPIGLWTLQPVPVVPKAAETGHVLQPACPAPPPPALCPEPVIQECPDVLSVFDGNRTEHLLLTGEGLATAGWSLIGLLVGFLICCLLRPLPWQYAGRRSRRTLAGPRRRSPVRE